MINIPKKINKGFTLVEILLVVGLITIMGIGVYSVYKNAQSNTVAENDAELFTGMFEKLRQATAAVSDFTAFANVGGTTPTNNFITSGIVPSKNISGTNITNFKGYNINVASTITTPKQMSFDLTGYNNQECIKLVNRLYPISDYMNVAGVVLKNPPAIVTIDPIGAVGACALFTGGVGTIKVAIWKKTTQ